LPETVISVAFDGAPNTAASAIFSTRSPCAKVDIASPSAATMVYVVTADITLGPEGRLTLTLAVALAVLPVNAGLVAITASPYDGVTVSLMMLPGGTPVVLKTTVTGLGVVAGKVMSALPVGLAGALTPATLLIVRVGAEAMNSGPGTPAK